MTDSLVAAAADPPAGGAAFDQVVIATAGGLAITAALAVLCLGHRSGRIRLLGWGAGVSEWLLGVPGWAALPSGIALLTLAPALFGLQWDESLHIAQGRDDGPLANPSHYLLLGGIFGGFAAGVIAIALADDRVPRSGIPLTASWRMPLGGVLLAGGSAVALLGFPLDDVWHRIFGQDVTLWSATHIAMIAGMSLAVLGALVLNIEGMRARPGRVRGRTGFSLIRLVRGVMVPAALLLVVSLLQGEFDYGVPQFRLIFHPMLIMVAAGVALVAARIFFGTGAALGAALVFLAIRGAIALIIGPVLGEPDHLFPLYLVEAALIELVALWVPTQRPLRFGLASGALIGTVGLAAEWAWAGLYPIPWPGELLPEAAALGLGMALAGSVLGAWLGAHMRVSGFRADPPLRRAAVIAAVALTAMIGYGLIERSPAEVRAAVTLDEVTPAPERTVHATLRLDPPDATEGAEWFRTIAWQGGGLETDPLREVSPGVYRTTEPLPVHGSWKTAIRLAQGPELSGIVLYAPADDAIPAPAIVAGERSTLTFGDETEFLRREAKDVAGWLWTGATVLVALIMVALLAAWAAALHRLARTGDSAAPERPRPAPRATVAGTPRIGAPA